MISVYAVLMVGFLVWTCSGPVLSGFHQLLPTGNARVDQFYSVLVLSGVFTPLAILFRNTAARMSETRPFMVTRKKAVTIVDLDRMSEGGINGARAMFPYSNSSGMVQAVLLISGSILVPCATLIISTRTTATFGTSVIGLRSAGNGHMSSDIVMDDYSLNQSTFQAEVVDLYTGQLLASAGLLPSFETNLLNNTLIRNLSLISSTWYSGLLTYRWNAWCEPAPEIKCSVEFDYNGSVATFVSPNGRASPPIAFYELVSAWSDSLDNNGTIVLPNITTYDALEG